MGSASTRSGRDRSLDSMAEQFLRKSKGYRDAQRRRRENEAWRVRRERRGY